MSQSLQKQGKELPLPATAAAAAKGQTAATWERFAWLPLPLLIAAMAALWVADVQVVWRLPLLSWLIHYGAVVLGVAFIVIPAARSFLANGEPSVLMLGCGVLMMDVGVTAMPSAFARSSDVAFASYNTSALLAALCHFTGVAIIPRRELRLSHQVAWLAGAYAGTIAVMGVVLVCAFAGFLPRFFVDGQGGTLLRTLVVGAAVALFVVTAGLLWQPNRRAASRFSLLYSLGLALLAAGLAGSVAIALPDSPLQWVARVTQLVGTVYMCMAVFASARDAGAKGVPLARVEQAWRESELLARFRQQTPMGWVLRYGLAVASVAVASGLRAALTAWVGPGLPTYITFYPVIMVVAMLAGFGPGLFATAMTNAAVVYSILPPYGQFSVAAPADRLGLVVFTGMGLFMSAVAELYRRNRDKAAAYDRDAAVRESEERFRAIAENSPDLITRYDRELRLLYANPALLQRTARPAEAFIGRKAPEYGADPAVTSVWQQAAGRALETGEPQRVEYASSWQGQQRAYDALVVPERGSDGRVASVLGVARDVTERKVVEEALRASEQRLSGVLESMPDAFVSFDRDMRYTYVNANAERLQAARREELLGKDVRALYPDSESHKTIDEYVRVIREQRPVTAKSYHAGFDRWLEVTAFPTPDGVSVFFKDVSAQVKAEEALRDANARLQEADQRKNEFLAVLSHELRNPLAPIANSLYILDHAPPGGDQANRAKEIVGRQVTLLTNLVNDLLDVTRITRNKVKLQKERQELNDIVRRAVEDNRSHFERNGVRLELATAPRPVPVIADGTRMAQVVSNLLQNAAKFTLKGGCTRVSVSAEGREAVVRVRDDGVGISSENMAQLFQPFMQAEQTLDRSKGGLGLGLALVKGLVELHGGTVSAHSDGLGKGTEFAARFPLDSGVALEAGATHLRLGVPRRRVLVIEDNVDAADSLREALELDDHEVEVAYNGPDGLAKARVFKPEVVFCDIGLPGMDGFEVARAFGADDLLKGTFLVALSGYALPEDLQRASEAGFERHVPKPPSLEKLERILAEVPRRDTVQSSPDRKWS